MATCLNCQRPRAIAARGLCSTCYVRPGVRELYPTRPPGRRGRQRYGPPARKEARPRERDGLVARLVGRERDHPAPPPEPAPLVFVPAVLPPTPVYVELTDDTAPAAIAAAQRGAVREARAALGPGASVEELSAAAVLPVWTVRRRLEELAEGSAA